MQAHALELRRRPAPGIRVRTVVSNGQEHFDIRIAEGGHPALKNRLVRRALAYGIDRVEIARESESSFGERGGSSSRSTASSSFRTARTTSRTGRETATGPARARRLLEQAGCRRGKDGIYSCDGNRLSLRFVTIGGIESRSVRSSLPRRSSGKWESRSIPAYAPFEVFFGTIVQNGDFDLALYSYGVGARARRGLGVSSSARRNRVTPRGYCDRWSTWTSIRRRAFSMTGGASSS